MFAAVTIAAIAATANGAMFTSDSASQKYMWEQFKQEHSRTYSITEEPKRFATFVQNLRIIDERNVAEKGSAIHGITKFSDMSDEEFRSTMLLSKPNPKDDSRVYKTMNSAPSGDLVDWSGVLTTPVKDQGYCGSCWAFSATEQIESDVMRVFNSTFILSPEQITECDSTSYGCGGGWTEHAYNYVQKEGGLETEADYPYTSGQGVTGQCKSTTSAKEVAGLSGYTTLRSESDMASYVESTGPLSVCLDANSWNSYTGGIMTQCGNQVDHCVQAVGVLADTRNGYWKVRNSWGVTWGEAGYIRLSYGSNTCDITSDPTYVDPVLN